MKCEPGSSTKRHVSVRYGNGVGFLECSVREFYVAKLNIRFEWLEYHMKMQTYTQRLRYCDIAGLQKPMRPQQKFPELIENEKCSTPADLMGKSLDNYLQKHLVNLCPPSQQGW